MNLDALWAVADRWRSEADAYERDGVPGHAALLRRVAGELTAAWQEWCAEELDTAQAAAESGYSETRLRELVREGSIPDNRPPGSCGPILIRRSDLPRKPGAPALSPVEDLAEEILNSGRP